MTKYEYLNEVFPGNIEFVEWLNDKGRQGWKLIPIQYEGGKHLFIRELIES